MCLSCKRIFPEGFARTCREESRHKQILIKPFFQLPRLVQFNFFSEIILTLTSFFIIVSFVCGITLARNPLEANAHWTLLFPFPSAIISQPRNKCYQQQEGVWFSNKISRIAHAENSHNISLRSAWLKALFVNNIFKNKKKWCSL